MKSAPKPFLWEKAPGVWYVRRKGQYWRIGADHGTEEFDREYWAILRGQAPAGRTSWRALIDAFKASDRWRDLKPRTRADYLKCFDHLLEKNADKDVRQVTRADAIRAMDANAHRIRFGNYVASVMSLLLEYALELGWMKVNPVKGVRHRRMPDHRKAAHLPWTDAGVIMWRAKALPLPRLIFELGVGTVQRPADLCRFRWGDYDGDRLTLTQGKTGKRLALPVTEALRAVLEAARPDPCDPAAPILRGPKGGTMTYRYLAAVMLTERRRLGFEAFDLHALRYRGMQELALAGCDDDEIASYSGHVSKAMVKLYTGEVRQYMRAMSAREKRG